MSNLVGQETTDFRVSLPWPTICAAACQCLITGQDLNTFFEARLQEYLNLRKENKC